VSDGQWNRVLYGSLGGDIKSYDNVAAPGEIVTNSAGKVFIAERGKARILVLEIVGSGKAAVLKERFVIEGISAPTSLAYNDNGTPLETADDFLYVANAEENTISKFALTMQSAQKIAEYDGFKWPVSIACGRWDGANNNTLFVVDNYAKDLSVYEEINGKLQKSAVISAPIGQTLSRVQTDHFGQVYVSDAVRGNLYKLTAELEILASKNMGDIGINDISIPFGTIEIEGEGKDFYIALAEHIEDPEVKEFLLLMAREEANHETQFKKLLDEKGEIGRASCRERV